MKLFGPSSVAAASRTLPLPPFDRASRMHDAPPSGLRSSVPHTTTDAPRIQPNPQQMHDHRAPLIQAQALWGQSPTSRAMELHRKTAATPGESRGTIK